MSNEYLKAADDAKRLLAGFKAVATVADAFEKVGSLVQAEKEATKALADINKQLEAARKDLSALGAAAASTKEESEILLAEAKRSAKETVDAATKKANAILAAGNEQRDALVTSAEAMMATARDKAQAYELDVSVKIKELADLEEKIEKVRAQAAKLLG